MKAILNSALSSYKYYFWGLTTAILLLYDITPRIDGFDTPYYFMAGDNLWHGTIDCLRTPVYPLLLKLFCSCFGYNTGIVCIVILQSIIYLISVKSLINITTYTIRNLSVRAITCLMYIVCVAPGWCNELMTESLSISGCVIIADLLCRYITKPSMRLSAGIAGLTAFLIFLRPSFIFLLAIQPFVWIVLWIRKKHRVLQVISLSLTILCSSLFLSYCKSYEKEYGVFTSSISFICNDTYNLKRSDSWDLNKVSNPKAKELLRQIDDQWCGNYSLVYQTVSHDHSSLPLIAQGCKEMRKGSEKALLRQQILITAASFDKRFNASVNTHTPLSASLFFSSLFLALPLSLFFSIVIISCIALAVNVFRNRRIPLIATVLILFTTAQCVGILLYASEAHERLLLPVYPLFLVLLGKAVDYFFHHEAGFFADSHGFHKDKSITSIGKGN